MSKFHKEYPEKGKQETITPDVMQALGKDFEMVGKDMQKAMDAERDRIALMMGIPADLMTVGGDSLKYPAVGVRFSSNEATWFVWFLPMIVLTYLAVASGGIAVAWFLLGMRCSENWILGAVSVASMVAWMWWMGRGQEYRRAKE